MVMQFSEELLNDWVAPNIVGFQFADLKTLDASAKALGQTMLFFGLQDTLGIKFKSLPGRTSRQFCRRCIAAVRSYEELKEVLAKYFDGHIPDSPKTSLYFHALDCAEMCLLQIQMAFETFVKGEIFSGIRYFDLPEDFRFVANVIKHFGERSQNGQTNGTLLPTWFDNTGIVSGENRVDFDDLAELLNEMIQIRNTLVSRA
jgi:hypothetical protein